MFGKIPEIAIAIETVIENEKAATETLSATTTSVAPIMIETDIATGLTMTETDTGIESIGSIGSTGSTGSTESTESTETGTETGIAVMRRAEAMKGRGRGIEIGIGMDVRSARTRGRGGSRHQRTLIAMYRVLIDGPVHVSM